MLHVGAQLDVAAEAGREAATGLGARVLGSCVDNAQARADHQLTAGVSLTFNPRAPIEHPRRSPAAHPAGRLPS